MALPMPGGPLVTDPGNPFDEHPIRIEAQGREIGYVQRVSAETRSWTIER